VVSAKEIAGPNMVIKEKQEAIALADRENILEERPIITPL
jgi:hypothetical protein